MRQRKWLALLLALMMVVTVTPVAYAEEETVIETVTEPETVAESGGDSAEEEVPVEEPVEASAETQELQLMASTSWQPKPTRTVSSASSFPLTLNNGDVLLINGPINFSASAGQSPITLASGASAKIIINGSVTLRGADASGITGATAAINVPEGAVLTIYSAHDEELSTSRSAPKDTLTVTGGNAAAGTEGGDALKDVAIEHGPTYHYRWYFGGGNGGAAAIGGNGGAGGAAGRAGSSGSAGTQTGTDGHGWNDAKLGNGGSDGSGVGINGTAASGSGGIENEKGDKKYNGGDGGAGGESVVLRAWHTTGSLILSTAANLNTYSWGDGGGQGSSSTLTPLVIYDLMDCQINLNQSVYTYTGSAFKPRITSVSYSAASDRDGRSISGSNKTLSGGYSAYSYGENIHCPTGTVTVLGSQNSKRTTVTNDGSVIGIVEKEFTIKKATLTAPITLSTTTPYVGQSMTATLSGYTSSTAGSGSLSTLLRASSAKAEGPKVTWSLTGGAVSLTYTTQVTISLAEGQASLYFANPSRSNQDIVLQIVVQDVVLAQSGTISPGKQVTTLDLLEGAADQLSAGGYNGEFVVLYYQPDTHEKTIVNTQIPVNITVQ